MLTLDYASPEQLRGEPIGTPSDVYSLAVLCYELLTRHKPYELIRGSIAQAAKAIVEVEPVPASAMAGPERRARLRGDLDAVLHKALKKDPADRYASMAELADDIERHLQQIPVRARPDRFHYRARKFLGRHRWQAGAAALVFAAVLAGGGAALWQAHAARLEAQRADVTKNFLVDILRTNDVRLAGDEGPRAERTVRQVLDTAAARVEEQFAGQPQTQVELLALIAVIYENYGEMDRYRELESRRAELARRYFGPGHPEVIRGLLQASDAAVAHREFEAADRLLQAADLEIRAARHEDPELRAGWLRVRARRLARSGETAERARLTEQSVALYRRTGRRSTDFAAALSMLARVRADQARGEEALVLMRESVRVAETSEVPDDAFLSGEYVNFARQLEQHGKAAEAHDVYRRAQALATRTWGKQSRNYWMALAWDARLLQFTGDRPAARPLLAALAANLPASLDDYNAHMAREAYADCLVRDGRVAEAIPLLEAAERHYLEHSANDFDVREVRMTLGDAYDQGGRPAEARERLKAARDEYVAKEHPGSRWGLRARERWARFLVEHGAPASPELISAEEELRAVIADAGEQALAWVARAHADLAQVALARGQAGRALEASQRAVAVLASVPALYDVRLQPLLWLIHGEALLASGDAAGARDWARKARAASLRYDDPTSPVIAAADDTLRRAGQMLGERG